VLGVLQCALQFVGVLVPQDGSGASFSLLTQVDERFSSFSPIDADSRVEVLSVDQRSICLEVRFADQHMQVEGTIKAPIRPDPVRGVGQSA
jgi:hypothetical protein